MWQTQPTPDALTDIQSVFLTAITIGAAVAGVWVGLARTLNNRAKRKTDEHPETPARQEMLLAIIDEKTEALEKLKLAHHEALNKIKQERDEARKSCQDAEESIETLVKANDTLGAEIRAKNALVDGLKLDVAKLPALESQVTALKVQVAGLTAEKSQWQTERDGLNARNAQLLKQYQEAIEANAPKPPPPPEVDSDTGRLLPSGD